MPAQSFQILAPVKGQAWKVMVDSYIEAGQDPLAQRAVVGAARFVVRKLAVVLDVKKSHDVFGETIALALAVDVAMENGWCTRATLSRSDNRSTVRSRSSARVPSRPWRARRDPSCAPGSERRPRAKDLRDLPGSVAA